MTPLSLLLTAALVLGSPKVQAGKIFFPETFPAGEGQEEPPREDRGLWESDLFFLQKLSGLFDVGQEQQQQQQKQQQQKRRYRPPTESSLRPELLPPQMFFPKRRGDPPKAHPGHLLGVRKTQRLPARPSLHHQQHLPPGHQKPQSYGPLHGNNQGVNPVHQNVLVIAPPTQELPPPPPPPPLHDAFPQQSQTHPISIHPPPPPPPPVPPKLSSSIIPIQPASNFPYQFVRPENPLSINSLTRPNQPAIASATAATPRPSFPHDDPLRPISSHPATPRPPLPPPPPKPVKTKKPTILGGWPNLSAAAAAGGGGGFFSNTRGPPKHPRPAPQPQRIFIPPHTKPSQKKDLKSNFEFKPSPQEGKTAADAFQPVFVASPFMDDLGEDVMKPMRVGSFRSSSPPVSTTTTLPELEDFF